MSYKLKNKKLTKKCRSYILLDYEETPVYKYKLKTSIIYKYNDENYEFEKRIMLRDLERILNLKFTNLKLKDVKDKNNYIFYAEMTGSIRQKFWHIEFVTTKPIKKEVLLYDNSKFIIWKKRKRKIKYE